MPTIKFSKEDALNILEGFNSDYETVSIEYIGKSRWSVHYRLTVKNIKTNKFYMAFYSVGATESQDESPWEYEDQVEFQEVEPYEKTVVEYRVVE